MAMCNAGSHQRPFTPEVTAKFPIRKFDVGSILGELEKYEPDKVALTSVGYKLIDLKLAYCYEENVTRIFNFGPALIVGNDEIEKISPATLGLLQQIHYRVYLVSILVETTLDLLHLLIFGVVHDTKSGKWKKLIEKIGTVRPIDVNTAKVFMSFHDDFRSPEFHKYSKVRGFLSKDQWTHLQTECQTAKQFVDTLVSDLVAEPQLIYGSGRRNGGP